MKRILSYFCFFILLGMLTACSAERNNIFSKIYHNTTARYNAWFIANEQMKEIDQKLVENHRNNYNDILEVFPAIDSAVINSSKEPLEDIIKKSSLVIQRHKNSKWVDNSYILVGKARYYQADFENAIATFKYVNTSSEEDDERHEALILLMRTFMDYGEESNAIAVSDFLKKEKLNDENKKNLELTRASLYQNRKDWPTMLSHMEQAAPFAKKRDDKARVYFILGQLYQQAGDDAKAYAAYKKCIRSNPEYEMTFYARLNSAQVYRLAEAEDLKKARKFFKKLLKDSKNDEYRDKIYYEMAEFEVKNGNLEEGMEYYQASAQNSVNNPRQKGMAYLRLGQIHYDTLKNYKVAKLYYDSTVSVLPQDEENFPQIKERQEVLAEFVQQLDIIQTQDSLLKLAEMDSSRLMAFLNEELEKQKVEKKKQEALAQKQASYNPYQQEANPFEQEGDQNGTWYFYNSSALTLGRAEFKRKWGDRALEDDWRRADKISQDTFADKGDEATKEDETTAPEQAEAPSQQSQALALYNTVPQSEEQKQQSLTQIEEAYFKLGNIYNFQLLEKENAAETFTRMLNRFPETEHRPEVLYLLYLINKNQNYTDESARYASMVKEEFPTSIYAKLIDNPNFKEENKLASAETAKLYEKAYKFYEAGQLDSAQQIIDQGINYYPENDYTDNLRLLEILLIGKSENFDKYKYELAKFIELYPESDLNKYAQELLASYSQYQVRQQELRGIHYVEYFDQTHNFSLIYPSKKELGDYLNKSITAFLKEKYPDLISVNLVFTKKQSIIVINNVGKDKKEAMEFYRAITAPDGPLKDAGEESITSFVITKDNFQLFYQNKNVGSYVTFFEQHYIK